LRSGRFGGIFRPSVRATTKERLSTFLAKKCIPRQNPGYAYGATPWMVSP